MKTVIILGKRLQPGSPRERWPEAELWGITHSNHKYKRFPPIEDWTSWWDLHPVEPTPVYRGIKAMRPATYHWYQQLPGFGTTGYRPLWLLERDTSIPASEANSG